MTRKSRATRAGCSPSWRMSAGTDAATSKATHTVQLQHAQAYAFREKGVTAAASLAMTDLHQKMLTLLEAAQRLQCWRTDTWSLFNLNSVAILCACSSIESVSMPGAHSLRACTTKLLLIDGRHAMSSYKLNHPDIPMSPHVILSLW